MRLTAAAARAAVVALLVCATASAAVYGDTTSSLPPRYKARDVSAAATGAPVAAEQAPVALGGGARRTAAGAPPSVDAGTEGNAEARVAARVSPDGDLVTTYAHGGPVKRRTAAAGGAASQPKRTQAAPAGSSPHARPSQAPVSGWWGVGLGLAGISHGADGVAWDSRVAALAGDGAGAAVDAAGAAEESPWSWRVAARQLSQFGKDMWSLVAQADATAPSPASVRRAQRHVARMAARLDTPPELPEAYRRLYQVTGDSEASGSADEATARNLEEDVCAPGVSVTVPVTVYKCDGVTVSFAQYSAILAAQALANATASAGGNSTATVGNTTIPILPPGLGVLNATCTETEESETLCACPWDYAGSQCQDQRTVECAAVVDDTGYTDCMRSNARAWRGSDYIEEYSSNNDGQPPCLAVTERTVLPFKLQCRFMVPRVPQCNGSDIPSARVQDASNSPPFYGLEGCVEAGFTYWLEPAATDFQFALTHEPESGMRLSVRPWNFDKMSDTTGSVHVPLSPVHLTGQANVDVPLPASDIPPTAWAGGRVVLGVSSTVADDGAATTSGADVHVRPAQLVGHDPTYTPPPPEETVSTALVVVLVLLGLAAVGGLAVAVWWKYGRARNGAVPRRAE